MSEEIENTEGENINPEALHNAVSLSGLYENWFLDYASYVILDRAVPHIHDGLKPVQRRILHSLKEMDDGRFNKAANVIGNTMKYHPHGDASIGDAMVQIGQKNLLIDTQGNWGDPITGDSAAAPRYIEARLSKFALDVVFNPDTTEWQSSYDGRNKEPVTLPVKFPLWLAQGADGIAVGLATKIMPHNFNELIDGSIEVLKGNRPDLLPDFQMGGMADFSNYNEVLSRNSPEDYKKLIDKPMSSITRFDLKKSDEQLLALETEIKEVNKNLKHLTDYAIAWFEKLKAKYGAGRERKTEIRAFDRVEAAKVALANVKLYMNREDGFIGTGLRKDEFICDCSDLDEIIVFKEDEEEDDEVIVDSAESNENDTEEAGLQQATPISKLARDLEEADGKEDAEDESSKKSLQKKYLLKRKI
ncbi:D gyraseB C domain containing protein [Daphnia sinensis]|uniref:D gyraseB C domain containing protein n=1 Tax=Daphnia sinensis TaxID=1820382 RepID=A0AAD5PJT0_9CRUS|nr:D gyraseB C domain containing protein [Daphnia sinensis]